MSKSITLCITAYDQDCHLIDNLLNMFKNQTVAPDEITVFCSGVQDLNIQKEVVIAGTNLKIRRLVSEKRVNQAVARNMSTKFASKEYCMFFDVDDIPHNQKIELTKTALDLYDFDFLVHSYEMGDVVLPKVKFTKNSLYRDLRLVNNCTNIAVYESGELSSDKPIHHSHIAVKRDILKKVQFNINPEFYRREDGKFCQDLIVSGYKGAYMDRQLINYTS